MTFIVEADHRELIVARLRVREHIDSLSSNFKTRLCFDEIEVTPFRQLT